MSGYIVYHPRRHVSSFGQFKVYHDHIGEHNQDPYVWNKQFLHTYCHITAMSPQVGDINFWVSGDTFPDFAHLYCDLVFVVAEKLYWSQANMIEPCDPIVDSDQTYAEHYQWAKYQHHLKRRRRYTLKADSDKSFQPQDAEQQLIDIVPFLEQVGIPLAALQKGLRAGFRAKPWRINEVAHSLYDWLDQNAAIKLRGSTLSGLRSTPPNLGTIN